MMTIVTRRALWSLVLDGLLVGGVALLLCGAWLMDWRFGLMAIGVACVVVAVVLAARRPWSNRRGSVER